MQTCVGGRVVTQPRKGRQRWRTESGSADGAPDHDGHESDSRAQAQHDQQRRPRKGGQNNSMHATVPRNADTRRRDGWVRCRKDSTTSTSRRTVSARSGSSAWRCVVPWSRASWCRSVSRGLSSAGTVGHHREAVHPALRALALKSASVAASPSASAAVLAVYGSGEERRDREERKSAARGWGVNTKWKCPVSSQVEMSGAGVGTMASRITRTVWQPESAASRGA